jgi:hypothetical protein
MKTNLFRKNNLPLLCRGLGRGFSVLRSSFPVLLFAALLLFSVSCEKDDAPVQIFDVTVQLAYPDGFEPVAGVTVTLRNTITGVVDSKSTDAGGAVTFTVIAGRYEASASDERADDLYRYLLNGNNSNITVTDTWTNNTSVSLTLTLSTIPVSAEGDVSPFGKLIIKELYVGGCQKDDGSGAFQRDPYIIIYNNSTQPAAIDNLAIGTCFPHNAHQGNHYFIINGELIFESEGWLPAAYGVWQITNKDTLAPGEQIVIAMNAGVNHTLTYSQSINFANPDYYVAYDPASGYVNTMYHPAPSELIPTAHYLKAYRLAGVTANAWTFSINSPAIYLFRPADNVAFNDYIVSPENLTQHGPTTSQVTFKVPRTWVIDGVEVFQEDKVADSKKRLTPDVDMGYVTFKNSFGYTLYRNVDKARTEAIIANAGKLVYDYTLGMGDGDPSGIDAEASIKNGAYIIYKDSNNATTDFHQRSRASLRD